MQRQDTDPVVPAPQPLVDNYVPTLSLRSEHTDGFWKRYDELADEKDREMSQTLNSNLDVLLIFAALFSAVNSSFIGLTMADLSPDPLDKTNVLLEFLVLRTGDSSLPLPDFSQQFSAPRRSIAVNCLVYASLCCSLFAAVGAMQAKEWLQNYDLTGQAGPLEDQGRLRQRKFNAVQGWQMERIIRFLPNLLLSSVLLFLIGLFFFLLPVNGIVAAVVIAIFGLGGILCGFTIIQGALSPLCPYQTSASRGLRAVVMAFIQYAKGFASRTVRWREAVRRYVFSASEAAWHGRQPRTHSVLPTTASHRQEATNSSLPPISTTSGRGGGWVNATLRGWTEKLARAVRVKNKSDLSEGQEEQVLNAEAACWLLEMTSDLTDQLTVAQTICSVGSAGCDVVLAHPTAWRRLLALTLDALQTWKDQPTPTKRRCAERFGAALALVMLKCGEGEHWAEQLRLFLLDHRDLFVTRTASLDYLQYVLTGKFNRHSVASSVEYSMMIVFLRTMILKDKRPLWAGLRYLTTQPYDDAVLSLSAIAVARGFSGDGTVSNAQSNQELSSGWANEAAETAAWATHPGKNLLANLHRAVSSGIPAWRSISKPSDVAAFLQLYAAFLRRLREFPPQKMAIDIRHSLWETVPILVKVINPQTGPNQIYRTRFSVEAVSLLKALDARLTKWDEQMHRGFWAGLLAATEMESALIGSYEFDSGFIFETFTWYLKGLGRGENVMGLDQYPDLLNHFSSNLKQELTQNGERRWQQLLSSYYHRLFSTQTDHIQNAWMERELSTYLVQWFQNSKTVEELRMCFHVIRHVVGTSAERARKLMADGFASAAAVAMIQMRESTHPSGDDWSLRQQFVLTTLILLWKWSEPATGKAWATASLLSAISPAVIQLAGRMDAVLDSRSQPQTSMQDSTISDLELDIDRNVSECGDQLRRLIEDIRQLQPAEAAYSDRSSSLQLCSGFMYLHDGML